MTVDYAAPATRSRWRPTPTVAGSIGLHCFAATGVLVQPELWAWAAGAIGGNHALLTVLGMWPRSTWLGPNITSLPPQSAASGEIALTFDDGPDPEVTPRVLDALEAGGAHATFFCIAETARRHPELCREIVRRGHAVENHSMRHGHTFALLGLNGFRREIVASQAALADITGVLPRFFRAPAGMRNPMLDPILHEQRLRLATWTRRGYDTRLPDPATVLQRLQAGLAGGDILLLHDGNCARARDGAPVVLGVLAPLLRKARELGLRPVTLRHAIEP